MEDNDQNINIAVISDYQGGYSEGFIKAHIDRLATCVIPAHQLSWRSDQVQTVPVSTAGKVKMKIKNLIRYNITNVLDKYKVQQTLSRYKIDVVLAEYGHIGILAHALLKDTHIPLVVHFHGIDAYQKALLHQRKQKYQEMFAYSRGVIAVSRDMEQQLISLGAPAEKVFYNTYGVDIDLFNQTAPSLAGPNLLAVGRFVDKKAPYLTILAFKKVLRAVPEARLTILGDGPLWHVCMTMVRSLNLERAVRLLGAVGQNEVASLMQKTRVFVQHSIVAQSGDSEGTPNTILEAGASGIPVVSTKHAGIKDIVQHGETGFLVEEGDIEKMAHHMICLLQNPSLADKMGNAARTYIRSNHQLEKSLDNLYTILLHAANNR